MKEATVTKSLKKKVAKIFIIAIILLILIIGGCGAYFIVSLSPVDANTDVNTEFSLERGWGISKVATELEKQHLIKNAFTFKVYVKLNDYTNFQAGTYRLSKSMSVEDIVTSFRTGENTIQDTISITFVEGKRFLYYVNKIAENFNYTNEEIMNFVGTDEYLNKIIKKYWFIDEDIFNKELYYPLEGYLFPDTYEFKKDASIEDIFDKMLTAMQNKLNNYKDEINLSGKKVSSLLTLASMVELEAVKPDDRLLVASVFNNRLKAGMTLGSDVTTYYAVKKEMTESLYMSDLNSCSAYNTRGTCATSGLPVGPICSPSLSSIVAAITPSESDNYYFVADINNNVYFSKTGSEQDRVIANLRSQGLWPE